jgi:aspartate racemase
MEGSARHIGILAVSSEGAALCYRTICLEGQALLGEYGHPEVTLHGLPMARHMPAILRGDWNTVAELLLASLRTLAAAGADFAVCPDNTVHQAHPIAAPRSPIPWLSIAEVVAEEARARGFRRLGILGTRFLMEGPVYPEALRAAGVSWEIPDPPDRERINDVIFRELVNAAFTEESRLYFNRVMEDLAARGCDAAVLGCTEIPLLVRPEEAPLPTLDSTRLLARAALRRAVAPA